MVVFTVSVTVVTAGVLSTARLSKLPPVADTMLRDTLPASTYTSSLGAGTLTLPLVAPAAMVIVAPPFSVTVTVLWAALVSVAV